MKRFSYAFRAMVTLITLGNAILMAQTPQQPPAPGPEVKKLEYFSGNWKSDGEMKPSSFGPAGKFSGTEHNEWMPGGFFLLSHSKETSSMGNGTGMSVYGYDPNEKVYTYNEFNSNGESVHAKGTFAGDTWTWTSEDKMQGKVVRSRFTVKVASPTAYSFKFEMAPEGGDWSTIMEGKATKTP